MYSPTDHPGKVLALLLVTAAGARAAAPVSLARFNPPATRAELEARTRGYPLFMGIKERDGLPTEMLALRIMLGDETTGIACERLRRNFSETGVETVEGRRREIETLKRWIEEEAAGPEFSQRYLSYRGEGGKRDPDFLIYMTPLQKVARFYGEVIFEIHEETPRGIDLNSVNRDRYAYYDSLTVEEKLSPKEILIREFFDRDEYVIPSHVPGDEVRAVTIRARLPNLTPGRAVRLTGRRLRRYQRTDEDGRSWVDLADRRGRHMARFTLDPEVPAAPASAKRSRKSIPEEILAACAALRIGGREIRVLR